ncbi:ribosomal protein [Lithospermum erythrorhizon]|uniref:Large ribosomal subunit protein mL45 n=1 Tax=Lithospermum erythrorhizon TaxID=34254 RepID=A0AAV3QD17_LITER
MSIARHNTFRNLLQSHQTHNVSHWFGSSRSFASRIANDSKCWRNVSDTNFSRIMYRSMSSYPCKNSDDLPWTSSGRIMRSETDKEFSSLHYVRLMATQTNPPTQSRQMGALKMAMVSPGILYEPYAPREKVSFWRRWFTKDGWKRTKEDIVIELKSAYSKQKFYNEAVLLYKEINSLIANGDKGALRKMVTENMYSILKNEIKNRESKWNRVYWELIEPVVKIRTLRARLIGVDKSDLNKAFIQLTLEFLVKQKFEAYDPKGVVVAGDKDKEILVRDIWVFEKSLFQSGAYWRLCGQIRP